jgi:hypothetical protein
VKADRNVAVGGRIAVAHERRRQRLPFAARQASDRVFHSPL